MELTAYKVLKTWKLPKDENFKFIAFGEMVELMISDSSLYQELWNVVMTWFMCVTITELYMNTGIQRSPATPMFADTANNTDRKRICW